MNIYSRAHGKHNAISVAAITGVLQRASLRKRNVKEQEATRAFTPEKKLSGFQLTQSQPGQGQGEGQQEMSRSNSQMSIPASQFPQQQSSTTVSSTCNVNEIFPCNPSYL